MSKLKKFLLLIPTAFIMLLNCMSFTAFAEDTTEAPTEAPTEIDFQSYYLDPEETIPEVLAALDFRKIENFPKLTEIPEKYAFLVYADVDNYNNYLAGSSTLNLKVQLFDLTDADYESNYYSMLTTDNISFKQATYKFDSSGLDSAGTFYPNNSRAIYSFESEYFGATTSSVLQEVTVYNSSRYRFYFETNVEEFGYTGSGLNIDVIFNPALSDTLDRSMTSDDGSKYLRSNFSMHVYNHNKFPIQYTMVISAALVDVDNVFCYYSNEWVYSRSLDSYDDYYNDVVQKQQKSTFAHYVLSGRTDSVNFNFNQINLVEGGIYTVRVYAGRNDCGYGSEFVLSAEDYASESYQINYSLVYESTFSVLQYDDVKYDPNNTSNGILPYNYGLSQKYNHSYNAVEKEDGEVDYTGKDVYSDNDSWYNHPIDDNSVSSSTSGTTSFSNFSKSFKNFFGFIKYMFNFLPKDVKTVFTLGFTGIMVIALVKVLFKS